MDWTASIDAYCERTDPSYWAEPVNAVTNAAFLIAAFVMWRRVRGQGVPLALPMVVVLALIGIGSFLFHTHATAWASTADVLPIAAFILLYLFAVNRHVWAFPLLPSLGLTALFLPWAGLLAPLFAKLPLIGVSAAYWPVALLIVLYAVLLRRRAPVTAQGLAVGGALLALSLVFRSLDGPLCNTVPLGTHFAWHLLNGLMLGWMIEVYRRHMLAGGGTGR